MSEFQECGGRGPARTAQQPWNEKDFKHSEYLYALLSTAFSLHYTLPLAAVTLVIAMSKMSSALHWQSDNLSTTH